MFAKHKNGVFYYILVQHSKTVCIIVKLKDRKEKFS